MTLTGQIKRGQISGSGTTPGKMGFDCVWLVDDEGTYGQTTDQESIRLDFVVPECSGARDLFGADRPVIGSGDSLRHQ
jgi:hypothetical protein